MKQLLFASAVALLAFTGANAQSAKEMLSTSAKPINTEDVHFTSRQAFYQLFGNVDARWSADPYYDQADFSNNGVNTSAYFDRNGELIGTTVDKTLDDLPANAQKKIEKTYKDYTVEKVLFYDDAEDNDADITLYGETTDDVDGYFVELKKDNKIKVLKVDTDGQIQLFAE